MGDAPNFNNLGVTDPVTGQNVFLTPQNLATVMGATGGVAPTGLQAGVQGFMSGMGQGQGFVGGISNIQAQQQSIAASKANVENQTAATQAGVAHTNSQTTGQDLQNSITQQIAGAYASAQQNSLLAKSAQMKIQTQQLQNTSDVLTAVNSGDPAQIAGAISNPRLILPSLENDSLIEAAYSNLQHAGKTTPDQDKQFQQWNTARDVFKAGPLQDQYQQSANGAVSTIPFQQLQGKTGLDQNQLLQGMRIQQVPPSANGQIGYQTQLVAPDGTAVAIDTSGKGGQDALNSLGQFFSSRSKLAAGGRYQLPVGAQVGANAPAPQGGNVSPSSDGSTEDGWPAQGPASNAPSSPAQSQAAPQEAAPSRPNPNSLSASGQPIQFSQPTAAPLNKAQLYGNAQFAQKVANVAQQEIAKAGIGQMNPVQAYEKAIQTVLPQLKMDEAANEVVSQNQFPINQQLTLANNIDRVIKEAHSAGIKTGPSFGSEANQFFGNIDTLNSNTPYDKVLSDFKSYAAQYQTNTITTSGLPASALRSQYEEQKIGDQGIDIKNDPATNQEAADRLRGRAYWLDRYNTLTRYTQALGMPFSDGQKYINDYFSDPKNGAFMTDPNSGRTTFNNQWESPIGYMNKKLGIDEVQAARDMFSSPTQLPKTYADQGKEVSPAAGSGTATPFAPAQKGGPSAFPTPAAPQSPNMRGVSYDSSGATLQDLHAIADSAQAGGNVAQFQQAGSVPTKLDKVTPDLIARVVGAESSGDPSAESGTGPIGLMQLSNAAFKDAKKADPTLTDRSDPRQNIRAGTIYFNQQLKKFDGNVDLSLAAYKDGPGAIQAMVDRHDINPATATVQQFAQLLPNADGNSTADYIAKITSRGRVQPPQQQQQGQPKGEGFFDQINPFHASEAQAEEPTGQGQAQGSGVDIGDTATPVGSPAPTTDSSNFNDNKGSKPLDVSSFGPPGTPAAPKAGGSPVSPGEKPIVGGVAMGDSGKEITTDPGFKVPPMEPSLRNDVPPVSTILEGMGAISAKQNNQPVPTTAGKAVEAIRNSPVGSFIADEFLRPNSPYKAEFESAQNFANAATFGLYDEGMGAFESSLGLDGGAMRDGIRDELKQFRKDYPRAAGITDILGSVAGGAGATMAIGAIAPALGLTELAAASFNPKTITGGMKIMGLQGAARGFGEGEGGIQNRFMQSLYGGVFGAATAGVTGALGASPGGLSGALKGATVGAGIGGLVGHQEGDSVKGSLAGMAGGAMLGASGSAGATGMALGALAGGSATGTLSGTLGGAAVGMNAGALAQAIAKNPQIQKLLAAAATRANNDIGFRTFAGLVTKVLTHKTPAQITANLDPSESLLGGLLSYVPSKQLEGWLSELKASKGTGIPVRFVDVLNDVSDIPTLVKGLQQLGKAPGTALKISSLLKDRISGQQGRIGSKVQLDMASEEAARGIIGVMDSAKKHWTKEAQDATRGFFQDAKEAVPIFQSQTLDDITSAPAVKEAIGAAQKDFAKYRTKSMVSKELEDLPEYYGWDSNYKPGEGGMSVSGGQSKEDVVNRVLDRMKAGESFDDILKSFTNPKPTSMPDNSYEILTRARRILDNMGKNDSTYSLKDEAKHLHDLMTAEMYHLSPQYEKAMVKYAMAKSGSDVLRGKAATAINDLAKGNVNLAANKLVSMPHDDFMQMMALVNKSPDFVNNPNAWKNVGKSYLMDKMSIALKTKNVASKLISDKEWKNLGPMLGDEADSIRAYVDAESRLAQTGQSLGKGSHTAPMSKVSDKLDEFAGGNPGEDASHVAAGSAHGILFKTLGTVLGGFKKDLNEKQLDQLAQTLILNPNKGIGAIRHLLRERKFKEEEISAIAPYIENMKNGLYGAAGGIPTKVSGAFFERQHENE